MKSDLDEIKELRFVIYFPLWPVSAPDLSIYWGCLKVRDLYSTTLSNFPCPRCYSAVEGMSI